MATRARAREGSKADAGACVAMRLITGLTYNFTPFVLYSDDCLDATQFAPNKHGLCQNCNVISSFKKLPNDGFCGCHVRPWTFWRHAPKPQNISVDWENFKERFRFHLCIEIISRHVLTFTTYTLRPEVCACKIREGGTNRVCPRARRGKRTQRSRIMVDISV